MTESVYVMLAALAADMISTGAELQAAGIRAMWEQLTRLSSNIDVLYQSPEWIDHLLAIGWTAPLHLGVMRAASGACTGVVPVNVSPYTVRFQVGTFGLWQKPLRTVYLMGSQPSIPQETRAYDRLFAALDEGLPQCDAVYMNSVPTESYLWRYLKESPFIRERFVMLLPEGIRPHHTIELPGTFEEYLAKFSGKTRKTLRRRIKALTEHGGGALELKRIESPDQVEFFVSAAAQVAPRSWQRHEVGTRVSDTPAFRKQVGDLAARGLLRSYVLSCGGEPCALALGHQFSSTYHYLEPLYDESLARFSPGTVLLCRILQDLISHRPPRRFDFGTGDMPYKRHFGNRQYVDAAVLLLRRNLKNRLLCDAHRTFATGVSVARNVLRRNVTQGAREAAGAS